MTIHQHLQIAENLAKLLDSQFSLLGFKFGLDGLLGFVPGIGDVVPLLFSGYILWVAKQAHVPEEIMRKMTINVAIDAAIGVIPVIGDFGDLLFKANERNLALLKAHLAPELTHTNPDEP